MSSFKDSSGKEWEIKLNIGLIEDIKEQTTVDIESLLSSQEALSDVVFNKPKKLVEVLYVICEEQCKRVPLEPREFGRLFDHDTLENACNAFMEAVLLFYPRSSVGRVLKRNLPTALQKMDEQLAEAAQKEMNKVLSNTVTN